MQLAQADQLNRLANQGFRLIQDVSETAKNVVVKKTGGAGFGTLLWDNFQGFAGTARQTFFSSWKFAEGTNDLILKSPMLAKSSWMLKGAQAGVTVLPSYLKFIAMAAVAGLSGWELGTSISKTYQAFSTYRAYHGNASREGILYNLIQGVSSGAAGGLIIGSLVCMRFGVLKPMTNIVMKAIPLLTGAMVASESMDFFQGVAENTSPVTRLTMGGVNNPFMDPKNGYVSPFWNVYQNLTLDLDNAVLGRFGVKRVPFITSPYGHAGGIVA